MTSPERGVVCTFVKLKQPVIQDSHLHPFPVAEAAPHHLLSVAVEEANHEAAHPAPLRLLAILRTFVQGTKTTLALQHHTTASASAAGAGDAVAELGIPSPPPCVAAVRAE